MDVECPYCSAVVDVTSLEHHVRQFAGDDHGPHGTVPVDGVDDPWQLRLDASDAPSADAVPSVELVLERTGGGRCPSCDRGPLGLKGGDGWLASGRRRLACQHCGWESPAWLKIRE